MTQENYILNFFEKICRSNIYLFIVSRYLIGRYFSKLIYDSDFKIIQILDKNNFFNNKKLILDIGANDGMTYAIVRKFTKKAKIISFEPIIQNFKILKNFKKSDKLFKCFNIGLINNKDKKNIFIPYYKQYPITQMAGINRKGVITRLKISLYIKNIIKKISFKKNLIKTKKLDDFNLKPSFIKIDIEGHELECIQGATKTIRKNKPIIMVEYDKKICEKIFFILKKYDYERFVYNKFSKKIERFKDQKVMNIFYVTKNLIKVLNI